MPCPTLPNPDVPRLSRPKVSLPRLLGPDRSLGAATVQNHPRWRVLPSSESVVSGVAQRSRRTHRDTLADWSAGRGGSITATTAARGPSAVLWGPQRCSLRSPSRSIPTLASVTVRQSSQKRPPAAAHSSKVRPSCSPWQSRQRAVRLAVSSRPPRLRGTARDSSGGRSGPKGRAHARQRQLCAATGPRSLARAPEAVNSRSQVRLAASVLLWLRLRARRQEGHRPPRGVSTAWQPEQGALMGA